MIPVNAEAIIAARMKGLKPADMVIVSLVGPVGMANTTVFAKPEQEYDWRFVRDLDICVYLHDDQDWSELLKAIAMQRPAHLNLWSHNGEMGAKVYLIPTARDIGKPVRTWKYELDFLLWMDFQNEDFKKCN